MEATMAADDSPYKPGDPRPDGYLNWHAWAEVQDKAGLRQKRCNRCGLWRFPQELNGRACMQCAAGVMASDDGQRFYEALREIDANEYPDSWGELSEGWRAKFAAAARAYGVEGRKP
jgi:ribosomal protein S27AE